MSFSPENLPVPDMHSRAMEFLNVQGHGLEGHAINAGLHGIANIAVHLAPLAGLYIGYKFLTRATKGGKR